MGIVKRDMERIEGLESQGMGLLIKTGAVQECPFHPGTFINQEDDEAVQHAYALGANAVKAGEADGDFKEMSAAIHAALANAGDECPSCAKNMED